METSRAWLRVLVCSMAVLLLSFGTARAFPNRVVTTIDVGSSPQMIAVSADSKFAYVTNSGDDTVSVIDLLTFQVSGDPIEVGGSPFGVAVNSDRSLLYVTNEADGNVSVVQLSDGSLVKTINVGLQPRGIAIEPDDSFVYVLNYTGGTMSVIKATDNTVEDTVATGLGPDTVLIDTVNDQLFVSNSLQDVILVFNRVSFLQDAAFVSSSTPQGMAFTPDFEYLLVANSGSGTTVVFKNEENFPAEKVLAVELQPQVIAVTPDGAYSYVTNTLSDSVTIINNSNFSIEELSLDVGSGPLGVAATPDGQYVLVANSTDNTVSVIAGGSFVTINSVNPTALNGTTTTESTITWTSDISGDYQVEVGGDGTKGTGTIIETGSVTADTPVSSTVQASDLTEGEGAYNIYIYVTDPDTGDVGRGVTVIYLDTTPPTVPANVGVSVGGSGKLNVTWDASTDTVSGVANYKVYYGTASGVYDATGSPADAGDNTSLLLSGLTNGVTYYIVVSAVDEAGNESAQSSEVSGSPENVQGSTSGGGCFIQTVGGDRTGLLWPAVVAIVSGLAVLVFRKKRIIKKGLRIFLVIGFLAAGVGMLVGPENASANDLNITGISWSFGAGYFIPTGERVSDAYDGGFTAKMKFTWTNVTNFETSAGVGIVYMDGSALDDNGNKVGSVNADLLYVPLDLTIGYRFKFSKSQYVVPYLDGGIVGAYYTESLENQSGDDGLTYGYEGTLGVRFDIGAFAPQDMASFTRSTSVKNVFGFVEGSYSSINRFGAQDFDLGGIGIMGGVELLF